MLDDDEVRDAVLVELVVIEVVTDEEVEAENDEMLRLVEVDDEALV